MSIIRVLVVLVCPAAPAVYGQYASIQGLITDQSQAVIPGVRVTATNAETGLTQTAVSSARGLYSIPFLPPGTYAVEASMPRFATARREGLKLDVNASARVDFSLKLGVVAETLTVPAAAALLESETTAAGQVVDNRRITELPLNGRNYLDLSRLAAAVAPDYGSRTNARGTFSAAGQRAYQVNVILDGVDNNSRAGGGQLGWEAQAVTPSIDAISEFKVVTNNNSAEYGFRMGGTVVVHTRPGTNDVHGSLYEFLRNDRLDAANFFAVGQLKPQHRRNQFGGTAGGPLVHGRTFLFGSYEATRLREARANISTVPVAAVRDGDFSGLRPLFDPATTEYVDGSWTREPFAGNRIPQTRFDPVARRVVDLYPAPNLPGSASNYFYAGSATADTGQLDTRLDHIFTPMHRVFARYSRRMYDGRDPGPMPLPADGGRESTTALAGNSIAGTWTATLSPALNNESRFGLSSLHTNLGTSWREDFNRKLGFAVPAGAGASSPAGMARFSPTGYTQIGTRTYRPLGDDLDLLHLSDTFMAVRGTHVVKAGFEFRRESMHGAGGRFSLGYLAFDRSFTQDPNNRGRTGDGLGDMLLGLASGGTVSNTNYETPLARNYSAFLQDDWRAARRLTLNLGLRWDRFGPPSSRSPVSRFEFMPGNTAYRIVRPKGPGDCGCEHDNDNFAPRAGVAFQAAPGTVLRGGFGIFYGQPDSIFHDGDARFNHLPPEYTELSFPSDQLVQPAVVAAQGFPAGLFPATEVRENAAVITAYMFMPSQYSMQWFADVQRRLPREMVMTLSYIGAGSRHMSITRELNQPLTPGPGALKHRKPWPFFSEIRLRDPSGNASYQAFAAKLEKRYAAGITFLGAYTWSHNIDNGAGTLNDGMAPGATAAGAPRDNYNLRTHRGNSAYDVRHNFTAALIYDLPFGAGRPRLGHLIGGWQIGAIAALRSGRPFSATVADDISNTGTANYPNRIRDGRLSGGARSVDRWFDVPAFAIPAAYTYGDSGRNILTGPAYRNLDLKLGKSFSFVERVRLDFRCEAFNVTNTPHFGVPNGAVDVPQAGQIRSAGDPRRVQMGMRLSF